jgi:uncharacterized protein (TIGR03905 family)
VPYKYDMTKHVRPNVGTCSSHSHVTLENGIITHAKIVGGCVGNTQAVCRLVVGRKAAEAIALLEGIRCQDNTSCPDQLAKAIREAMEKAKD